MCFSADGGEASPLWESAAGCYAWGVFEDAATEGRFVETFLVESWLEHLRQHERVTKADRAIQDMVESHHLEGAPAVTHLVAAQPE